MKGWQHFSQQFSKHSREFQLRLLDKQLTLGITGLSGAGKTAFITSVVNQLTSPQNVNALAFLSAAQQQRYLGGKIKTKQPPQTPRFPYEANLQKLQLGQWPDSTKQWSQLSLEIRYQPEAGLAAHFSHFRQLQLDVVDYPGEWLLDLPMLQQDYAQWCAFSWELMAKPHRKALSESFHAFLKQIDLSDDSELQLARLTEGYRQLLLQSAEKANACLLQPGRLILPGELTGTPLLQLFPLLPEQLSQPSKLAERLQQNFQNYQKLVIQPFFQNYFARLDRQVVLVDCLSALNAGFDVLQELQQALMLILQSFYYGPSGWLKRLIHPRISKVLFAASKADQLTPDQHKNMTLLLQQLLQQPLQDSRFQSCQAEAMALAAVVTTQVGLVKTADAEQPCVQGIDAKTGHLATIFPGEVPMSMPSPLLFKHHAFSFPDFLPRPQALQQPLPHLRIDQALEFLIGDKLR